MSQPPSSRGRLEGSELVATLADPASIAIVGASADPSSYGGRAVTYLRYGYAGRVTLVNPNHPVVDGRECLASAADIPPGSAEVALVATRAELVPEALRQLATVGTKAAVAIAGDMTEEHKEEVRLVAQTSEMRVIGPNCIGVVSSRSATYLSFSAQIREQQPPRGSIALVTQSGAMGNALLASLRRRGAGISHWITTGDEVDVGALELVAGLLRDPDVRGVGVFFEGMGDVAWLAEVERAIAETGNAVYAVKGAKTAAGRSAASGHTGRVVGSAEASLGVMREAGIVDLPDMTALADALVALELVGRPRGPRVGIVTISGGAGVLAADAVVESPNLELAAVTAGDPELASRLGGRVHEVANPLDVAGSPTAVFADWANTLARRPSCDAVLAIEAKIIHDEDVLVRELVAYDGREVPLVLADFSDGDPLSDAAVLELARARIPVFRSAERAVAALNAIAPPRVPGEPGQPAPPEDEERGVVGLEESIALLGDDLPWARHAVLASAAEAPAAAERLGFPLVVKVAGRAVQHRSELGGVKVGVDAAGLAEAVRAVEDAAGGIDLVMLQEQAAAGAEVLVSVVSDGELGPVAYVRPGGILTELVEGTAIVWSGWDPSRRRRLLRSSTAGRLLLGYRGRPVYDLEALADLVDRLLELVQEGAVEFVELNPVIVGERGVTLVDALVRPAREPDQIARLSSKTAGAGLRK